MNFGVTSLSENQQAILNFENPLRTTCLPVFSSFHSFCFQSNLPCHQMHLPPNAPLTPPNAPNPLPSCHTVVFSHSCTMVQWTQTCQHNFVTHCVTCSRHNFHVEEQHNSVHPLAAKHWPHPMWLSRPSWRVLSRCSPGCSLYRLSGSAHCTSRAMFPIPSFLHPCSITTTSNC